MKERERHHAMMMSMNPPPYHLYIGVDMAGDLPQVPKKKKEPLPNKLLLLI